MSGELERIQAIRTRVARPVDSVRVGVGDDAAVIRPEPGMETVVSTDLLVEGVHFRREWATADLLGRKSLAISLSDMAAMGAAPRAAFLSLAVPDTCDDAFLEAFYSGAAAVADRYGVTIAGGDLSSSPGPLCIDSVVTGEVETDRALLRSRARAGQALFVSGALGSSAFGLEQLRSGVTLETATTGMDLDAIRSHLAPTPRIELGRALVMTGYATAAIDISDGLSSDIRRICEASGVGVIINGEAIPTSYDFELALHGGEQYELLFAADTSAAERLALVSHQLKLPITCIGRFEGPASEVLLELNGSRTPLPAGGWEHFS